MLKPQLFQQANVTVRNLPYTVLEGSFRDSIDTGGVLGSGQLVWTEDSVSIRPRLHIAVCFVDGIGMVHVDPRWLVALRAGSDNSSVTADALGSPESR